MRVQWKKLGSILLVGALSFMLLTACGNNDDAKEEQTETATATDEIPTVGIIQYMEHGSLDAAREGVIDGLEEAGFVEGESIEFLNQNAQGDQSNLQSISQQFTSNDVDAVIAIATQSAQAMASASEEIPIVGTAITDYVSAKLADSEEEPGHNVTGTNDKTPVEEQIDLLEELVPDIKKVGTIYSSSEINSELQVEALEAELKKRDMELVKMTVSNVNDIQQAATNLVTEEVEAIYVPTDNTVASAMSNLSGVTDPKGIPLLCGATDMVKDGGTISLGVNYYDLGKSAGEYLATILKGEGEPATMPIKQADSFDIVVNDEALKTLKIELPDSIKDRVTTE